VCVCVFVLRTCRYERKRRNLNKRNSYFVRLPLFFFRRARAAEGNERNIMIFTPEVIEAEA
jgi:hypothetical protein